jgi:hypothetical protein
MTNRLCPSCGQSIPEFRCGVRLTPLKTRLFDLVKHAGPDGIATEDARDILGMSVPCFKSHVWQINDLLADEGWRLSASRGRGAVIRLVRVH